MITNVSENNLNRLVILLAMLRGLKWTYWNYHWTSKGSTFYQSHLLFERLYSEKIDEQIDTLAEKITTYNPTILAGNLKMLEAFEQFVKNFVVYRSVKKLEMIDLYKRGLEMEKQVQVAIEKSYTNLKEVEELSLGMDDYLMSLANQRETVIYLLRQQLR
jgi:hypothetical protein